MTDMTDIKNNVTLLNPFILVRIYIGKTQPRFVVQLSSVVCESGFSGLAPISKPSTGLLTLPKEIPIIPATVSPYTM